MEYSNKNEHNKITSLYQIEDKKFEPFISKKELEEVVTNIAKQINECYSNCSKPLIIIGILNGAFIFLADLVKKLDIPCEIHFIKVSSYIGTQSSGTINEVIGLKVDIRDRDVLIVEDIIDTGLTMQQLNVQMGNLSPNSLRICTMLFKEINCKFSLNIDFIGKTIPDKFVIGYGLDYNNLGRNLDSIYVLSNNTMFE